MSNHIDKCVLNGETPLTEDNPVLSSKSGVDFSELQLDKCRTTRAKLVGLSNPKRTPPSTKKGEDIVCSHR